MSKRILIKPTYAKVANMGQNVLTDGYDIIGVVSEGTLSIEEGEVSTEERKAENGDVLYSVASKDPINVTFNLADWGEEVMASIFNRTLVSKTINGVECKVYEAKSSIKALYKQMAIQFQSDEAYIWFPNLQTYSSMSMANIATEEAYNAVTAVAYPDASGNIYYIVYPIQDVEFGTITTSGISSTGASVNYSLNLKSGVTVSENGVVYSTTPDVSIEGGSMKKTASGNTAGSKTVALTALASGTKYYAKTYATKDGVNTYSSEFSFTTSAE